MKIIHDFIDPETLSPDEFDTYLAGGWYRMYQRLFTVTHWLNCETFEVDRVWWLRYHIDRINKHSSHQRIIKKNRDFEVEFEKYEGISEEDRALYNKYRLWITFDGYITLRSCLYGKEENKHLFNTWSVSVRDEGKLIAKGLIDLGTTSVMAKVNFFDPDYAAYSPGKYLMLKTIDFMRMQGLSWYYPGYVIVGRPKFDYKLFLGAESAEYYDPEVSDWKPYHPEIMQPEQRTEEEEQLLEDIYFRF
ncbi:MAG: hypothetical protein ACO3BD_06495 [Chitinophagaceae bacterium]